MRFVHILVEGQTEDSFVRQVLRPYFAVRGLHLSPVLVSTKRAYDGKKFKGGINSYAQLKQDLRLLLHDTSVVAVSTMLDFYGLPETFAGRNTLPSSLRGQDKALYLENAFAKDIGHSRFLPYLSLHEFESLVLVSPEDLEMVLLPAARSPGSASLSLGGLAPEDIDDGPKTHPAARIKALFPSYRKTFHGPLITGRIGLARLRECCPHFGEWVSRLEALGVP